MGSMSASDAAPLPRLGEVFFDVRGNSRSMRLSWYADTGVAVFSIWQGGTCTGTFRLPIDDLTRMVEALRRGPQGPRARREASRGQVSADQAYGRDLGSRDPGSGRGAAPAVDPGDGPDPGPSTVAMRPPSAADARIPVSRADVGYDDQLAEYPDEAGGYHDEPAGYQDAAAGYPRESGGYPSQPGGHPSQPGGYPSQAGGHPSQPGGYPSEPGGYSGGPGGSYPGEPPLRGYREDSANGDYPGGYPDEPATGDYRTVAPAGYRDDPLTGEYRGAAADYRDDRAGYRDAPAGYRGDSADYSSEPPLHGYSGDPSAGGYRGGPAGDYRDNSAGGYGDESVDYPVEPLPSAYPAEPPFRDYGHESAIGDYPGESPEHDLESPPGAGGYEPPSREWEDTDVGPRGSYSEDPSPESFPYGRPPGKRRQRDRGRYPGRH
jgi:hypothetical protein